MRSRSRGRRRSVNRGTYRRVLSREIHALLRKQQALRDPTPWRPAEGNTWHRQREVHQDPARSETPSMYVNTLCGNREIPRLPTAERAAGRIGKSKDVRRRGKSDRSIEPAKSWHAGRSYLPQREPRVGEAHPVYSLSGCRPY